MLPSTSHTYSPPTSMNRPKTVLPSSFKLNGQWKLSGKNRRGLFACPLPHFFCLRENGAKFLEIDLSFFFVVERVHQRLDIEVKLEHLLDHVHHAVCLDEAALVGIASACRERKNDLACAVVLRRLFFLKVDAACQRGRIVVLG